MALCGCNATCPCIVTGRDGILVTGSGSGDSPITIALDPTQGTGCGKIMDCMCSHIGVGLRCDPATKNISVGISSSAGNNIVIGGDGGLFSPGCAGCASLYTTDMLPTTGIMAARNGVGKLLAPHGTREMVSLGHAYADRPVLFGLPCQQIAGERSWWYMNDTAKGWSQHPDDWRLNYASQYNLVPLAPVPPNGFCGGEGIVANDSYTSMPISVNEILRQLGGQAVIVVSQVNGVDSEFDALVLGMVKKLGLMKCVIYRAPVAQRARLVNWAAQGGQAMITIATQAEADAITAASLVTDGIKWVDINVRPSEMNDAGINKFTGNASLRVLGNTSTNVIDNSHAISQRAKDRGCQGLSGCHDTVYQAGPWRANDQRLTTSPFASARHGAGSLTSLTPAAYDCASRGQFLYDPAVTLPSVGADVWFVASRSLPTATHWEALQGWACPIANAAGTYQINGYMRMSPVPSTVGATQYMGVAFCAPDDTNFDHRIIGTSNAKGYSARVRSDGQMELGRWNGDGTETRLVTSAVGAAPVASELAWRVSVTPTQIQFSIGNPTPTINLTSSDTTYRGGYFFLLYRHDAGTNGEWDARYRRITIT